MIKIYVVYLLAFLLNQLAIAQTTSLMSVLQFDDRPDSIALDSRDNILLSGTKHPSDASGGNFIRKLDKSGTVVWSQTFSSTFMSANALAVDKEDNIVLLFDGLMGDEKNSIVLRKYSSSGTIVWSNKLRFSGMSKAYQVTLDSQQNIFIVGWGQVKNSKEPGPLFLGKFSAAGTQLWLHQFGKDMRSRIKAFNLDSQGRVLIAVWSDSSSSYLVAFDQNGKQVAKNEIEEYGLHGKKLSKSELFEALHFTYAATITKNGDLCATPTNSSVKRYGNSGKVLWTQPIKTAGEGSAITSVFSDNEENCYFVSQSEGRKMDVFIHKFDRIGKSIWSQQLGTNWNDYPTQIAFGKNEIFLIGNTDGVFPGNAVEGKSSFLAKLDTSGKLVDWTPVKSKRSADSQTDRVRKRSPKEFNELPKNIQDDLEKRNCMIPQSDSWAKFHKHNVIRGNFAKGGQEDWAIVCKKGEYSSVVFYWGGADRCEDIILKEKDPDVSYDKYISPLQSGIYGNIGLVIQSSRAGARMYTCQDSKWKIEQEEETGG